MNDDDIPGDINPDPDDEGFWCPKFLMPCDAVPWGGCHRGYAPMPARQGRVMIKPIGIYRVDNGMWWALIKRTENKSTIARTFSLKTRDEAEAQRIWDDYCACLERLYPRCRAVERAATGRLN